MLTNDFIKNIIQDVSVDLSDEFDRNFERKAFFDRAWKNSSLPNHKGSLMMRTGGLRRSIRVKIQNGQISWSSSLPYASIHNEGGNIIVTQKMKSFFWAMYYKSSGAVGKGKSDRNTRLSAEALQWKGMALMKVGHVIKIEQRQFIGNHQIVKKSIETIVNKNMQDLEQQLFKLLKK